MLSHLPLRRLHSTTALSSAFWASLISGRSSLHLPISRFPSSPLLPDSPKEGVFVRRWFSGPASRPWASSGPLDPRTASTAERTKNLVEDEAELSDWISDLKTSSFRLGLSSSDGDDLDRDSPRSSIASSKSWDKGKVRSRDGGRVVVSGSSRRGGVLTRERNSDSDEFSGFPSTRKSRNSRLLSSRRHLSSDLEDEMRFSSRDSPHGNLRNSRVLSSRRHFDSDLVDGDAEEDKSRFTYRGLHIRNSRNSKPSNSRRHFDNDLEDEDEGDGINPSRERRERAGRGGVSAASAQRGGRDVGSRTAKLQCEKRFKFDVSEEEEDEEEEDEHDEFSGFEDDLYGSKEGKKEEPLLDAVKCFRAAVSAEGESIKTTTGEGDSYLSQTRFDECSISPLTLKAIKAAGYERMTIVQEATLPVILKGKDVLAKAKTGTGKTVAFLLPAIEVVSKLPPTDRDQRRPPINVVVVCPTRELADQAAAEAENLLKFHPSINVQLVIGGTRLALEQKRMQTKPSQILVATPGRLRDHMENTPGFAARLMGVKVLVLDEADRLLDMGFRRDIEKIVAALPKQRQSLLFSATVPDEVRQICYIAMRRDLEFINTVKDGSEETHSQVKQMHLVAPLEKQFPILYGLLTEHISENVDYKVIVFCTTAMVTKLVADLLSELQLNIREIHSRKPQAYRTRVSKEFKVSQGLILVSSDVSARGVDYPNVTLVIQLGVPVDREQYIHRVGRTGRKGKEGTGILILAPWEEFFLRSIKDLPLTEAPIPLIDPNTRKKVERALAHVEVKDRELAYQAWLGYYNSNKNVGRDKYQLVALANEFSRSMGLNNPPALPKLVLGKMGLTNIPGLRSK